MPETVYQLKDIARLYGVGASAVANWRKRGSGPRLPEPAYVTTGGRELYSRAQFEEIAADITAQHAATLAELLGHLT